MNAITDVLKVGLKAFLNSSKRLLVKNYAKKTLKAWESMGRPVPPPQIFKHKIIMQYAKIFHTSVFVETGTYYGDTVFACKNRFKKLYSIELDKNLFNLARARFSRNQKIVILNGDSGEILKSVLQEISVKTLFWLDGHYSAGVTAKGNKSTPIMNELTFILNHKVKDHVILIDDARYFTGQDDYPKITDLKSFIERSNQNLVFKVEDDIIQIHS